MAVLSATRPAATSAPAPVSHRFRQQRHRLTAANALEAAKVSGDARQFSAGKAVLMAAAQRLQADAATDSVVAELVADLKECADGMKDARVYASSGQHQMVSYAACHGKQRSNWSSVAAVPNARVRRAYVTPQKMRKKCRAARQVMHLPDAADAQ